MNDLIFVCGRLQAHAQVRFVDAGGGSTDCDSYDDRVDRAGLPDRCHSGTGNTKLGIPNLQWCVAGLAWEVCAPSHLSRPRRRHLGGNFAPARC